ncbi:glycerol-3-phosphate 1-O-acyltransferase PlsY [Phycicoccus sp. Soil803]|uniref:glycerol-3-phosphate 1-O-acyltransferase PlsY n=1 Tax=Phycicoccus sp. Soil803 TaxID=1736415 RepID=UPI00070D98C0|nr:glycerol-3-phosphate 1-O-acyltransferase PlsY [Phycicoccus sp. Soil803]KRF25374.1 acyl-phosphate glycerol 3-phosphate acyltransferase [Phycicoccus sp. Soil803]
MTAVADVSTGELVEAVVASLAAFVIGAVNPATILAKLLGKDLRHSGSGNPGATNAGRVLGARWGVVVGVLDVLKGLVPVLVAQQLLGTVTALFVGLAVVLGHIWSPFLRGQGGKGVATSLGAILAVQPWFGLGMVVVFGLLVWRMRWVAGASVSACLLLLLLGLLTWFRWVPFGTRETGAWCVLLALVVIYRHRRNIELWISARRDASSTG